MSRLRAAVGDAHSSLLAGLECIRGDISAQAVGRQSVYLIRLTRRGIIASLTRGRRRGSRTSSAIKVGGSRDGHVAIGGGYGCKAAFLGAEPRRLGLVRRTWLPSLSTAAKHC